MEISVRKLKENLWRAIASSTCYCHDGTFSGHFEVLGSSREGALENLKALIGLISKNLPGELEEAQITEQ